MTAFPDSRLTPATNVRNAVELFGGYDVIDWCEALLGGERTDAENRRYPDIAWLGGRLGWPSYWSRV